jgi:hypothetical protein
VKTAFLVALEAGELFAEFLLGEGIEFAVAGGYEGVVARKLSVNLIWMCNVRGRPQTSCVPASSPWPSSCTT